VTTTDLSHFSFEISPYDDAFVVVVDVLAQWVQRVSDDVVPPMSVDVVNSQS